MKKISLETIHLLDVELLSKDYLKNVFGGNLPRGTASDCSITNSNGICAGNCMRANGAADKCRTNSSRKCTCGGI